MRNKEILLFCILLVSVGLSAQDNESKVDLNLGSDFMSRYVWRGVDYGQSPSIQPGMALSTSFFEFGVWGAYATNGFKTQEVDLYLTYNIVDAFSVTITDYFFPDEVLSSNSYFEYQVSKSGHIFELMLSFNGIDKLPVSLMSGTVIY